MKDLTKRVAIRSKAIRDAANGEDCTVCGRNDKTTVFCHLNEGWAGKGMGQKADDIAGFFGCGFCHDRYDGRGSLEDVPYSNDVVKSKRRGCPTCDGVDPKTCLRCQGKTRQCDWYFTDRGWVHVKVVTIKGEKP